MTERIHDFKDKSILVVGMGRSGEAAARVMLELGARVAVQDSKTEADMDPQLLSFLKEAGAELYLGKTPDDMSVFDMLILSPGVPPALPFIREAEAAGAEVTGELEIAYRAGRGRYVAITGTNGKTTTTSLVGEIYAKAVRSSFVVGNIGVAVLSKAMEAEDDSWLVTECSSFQLETIREFRPEVSAILNLTPDHLDRHGDMEGYGRAKANIFANQTKDQYCILNYDDKACFALGEGAAVTIVPFSRMEELEFGAFVRDGNIVIRDEKGAETVICGVDELKIPGTHNLENALAACAIAYFGGIAPETIAEVLREFAGVEHRIELWGEIGGVRFVNDSKGTNTDAAIKAIEAMKENIILIAGGYDKGATYEGFVDTFPGRVKKLVLLGKTAPKIRKTAEDAGFTDIVICEDMEECVRKAYESAVPGDVVLLSPACASWDMYPSFEVRGRHFKECAAKLKEEVTSGDGR